MNPSQTSHFIAKQGPLRKFYLQLGLLYLSRTTLSRRQYLKVHGQSTNVILKKYFCVNLNRKADTTLLKRNMCNMVKKCNELKQLSNFQSIEDEKTTWLTSLGNKSNQLISFSLIFYFISVCTLVTFSKARLNEGPTSFSK